jgi:hypothetical protein
VNALTTHVFLFDETTAATTLHSVRDLIAFIESFAKDQGYSSARTREGLQRVSRRGRHRHAQRRRDAEGRARRRRISGAEGHRADEEGIFPDAMSRQLYAHWASDHKAVERQFATM